jgi:hypothetical protein
LLKPPLHFWTWPRTQSLTLKKDGVEDSAQVSKFSKGKYLGLTKVVLGIKQVIGNAVAVVLGKVVKPQLQRHLKTVGGKR